MSRLSEFADKKTAMAIVQNSTYGAFAVENFMGGTSYTINIWRTAVLQRGIKFA
jgi:hypothetical protein